MAQAPRPSWMAVHIWAYDSSGTAISPSQSSRSLCICFDTGTNWHNHQLHWLYFSPVTCMTWIKRKYRFILFFLNKILWNNWCSCLSKCLGNRNQFYNNKFILDTGCHLNLLWMAKNRRWRCVHLNRIQLKETVFHHISMNKS